MGLGLGLGVGSGVGSGVGFRVRKLLTSVPLEAIRHGALQPRDRAALLLGHELAVPGKWRQWRQGQG